MTIVSGAVGVAAWQTRFSNAMSTYQGITCRRDSNAANELYNPIVGPQHLLNLPFFSTSIHKVHKAMKKDKAIWWLRMRSIYTHQQKTN